MPKIELKDKLLQVKISTDFYQRIVKYCQKYSASISAGATSLMRRQLDTEERKGVSTEVEISEEIKNEILKFKQPYDSVSDYVEKVMRDHISYRYRISQKQEANPYASDTKYDKRDNINQDKEYEDEAIAEFKSKTKK